MAKSARRMLSLKRKQKLAVSTKIKMKTKTAAKKRYKVLGSGKVKCPGAMRSHFLSRRSRTSKNQNRRGKILSPSHVRLVRRCLPNSF